MHISTSFVRLLPLLCQSVNARMQVLTRGPERTTLAPCRVLQTGVVSAKSDGTHKRGLYISEVRIYNLSSLFLFSISLSFLKSGEVSAEPGTAHALCAGVLGGFRRKSRSICSGYVRYGKNRGINPRPFL